MCVVQSPVIYTIRTRSMHKIHCYSSKLCINFDDIYEIGLSTYLHTLVTMLIFTLGINMSISRLKTIYILKILNLITFYIISSFENSKTLAVYDIVIASHS